MCHTDGSSAWDSASSANLGSRCVGLKGSAILQERPSFKPNVALLPTASCTLHCRVMPGACSTYMHASVWVTLLIDRPSFMWLTSTQAQQQS